MYLVQFQNRVLVFIQWGFQYLTFSRGARLITGTTPSDLIKQRVASESPREQRPSPTDAPRTDGGTEGQSDRAPGPGARDLETMRPGEKAQSR
jgi:NADH dehydrogenase